MIARIKRDSRILANAAFEAPKERNLPCKKNVKMPLHRLLKKYEL